VVQDLTGQTLGQYRIVEQLGRGGMATVFKAFQPSLERYVAIKILPPYYAHEPGFAERFIREAKAVARLEHPHIMPIHDFGQEGDYTYIVMKYVPAGTLKDLIASTSLSLEQATDIISQIASALDHAHAQGIVHRDVKPSNVLMDQGEWAFLMDFGLAKMVEGSKQLTASGVGVGTPAYMAPEQGRGEKVDGRADVYSLGIVLYEMLTGQVPFDAETPMAVVLKHITAPLPMPRSVNPVIPESVERVMLKSLAKDPADRYATAGEMATALRQAKAEGEASPDELLSITEPMPVTEKAAPALVERPTTPTLEPAQKVVVAAPKRKLPWWAFVVGVLSLVAVLGVILVAAGVIHPPVASTPVPALGAVDTPTSTVSPTETPTVVLQPTATSMFKLTETPATVLQPTATSMFKLTEAPTTALQPTLTSMFAPTPTPRPTETPFSSETDRVGTFADSGQRLGSANTLRVAVGDLDGDGDLDAFAAGDPNQVWLNDGMGIFADSGQALSAAMAVALGDLDGDGDLDALAVGGVSVLWLNDGTAVFVDSGQALGIANGVALGDLDGDGDLDALVVTAYPPRPDEVWLNDGAGNLADSGQRLGNLNASAVALGDLDGDGDIDAFIARTADEGLPDEIWLNDGAGNLTDSGQRLATSRSMDVALGDVDGDGDLDALVGNCCLAGNRLWLNDGTAVFVDSGQDIGSLDCHGVALDDLDGDGDLDAFVVNFGSTGSQPDAMWLNDGQGQFTNSGRRMGSSRGNALAVGDLDGDGDLDVFIGNSGPDTVWMNRGAARE
jgi:serine/threonine protein kinase